MSVFKVAIRSAIGKREQPVLLEVRKCGVRILSRDESKPLKSFPFDQIVSFIQEGTTLSLEIRTETRHGTVELLTASDEVAKDVLVEFNKVCTNKAALQKSRCSLELGEQGRPLVTSPLSPQPTADLTSHNAFPSQPAEDIKQPSADIARSAANRAAQAAESRPQPTAVSATPANAHSSSKMLTDVRDSSSLRNKQIHAPDILPEDDDQGDEPCPFLQEYSLTAEEKAKETESMWRLLQRGFHGQDYGNTTLTQWLRKRKEEAAATSSLEERNLIRTKSETRAVAKAISFFLSVHDDTKK